MNLKKPGHEYHVFHTIGWSLHFTNITLNFDGKSENVCYGKTRFKCDLELGHCPRNHAIKATVFWELNNLSRYFDVGRSYARVINFQKHFFIEATADNETNSGH